jgi:hypothetical protein
MDRSEEGRRFFQQRLALMFRIGLILSASFLVAVVAIRGVFGASIAAELRSASRLCHLAATLALGAIWLYVRRSERGLRALEVVDIAGCLTLCLLLDLQAVLFPVRTVAVFNLVLTTGIALVLRAVVVPSPTRRTAVVAGLALAAAVGVFFASLHPAWPVAQRAGAEDDWHAGYQLTSLVLWLGSLAAISVVASQVIYGLRREIRAAHHLGQYVLERKLGEGGMGMVFHATHAMLRRDTALKLLSPERVDETSIQRFEREVVQTARLRHPNTVAIYDYGRTPDGVFYYAMEYLDGVTLQRLVDDEGPVPPGRLVHLLAQVCASLDEAHAAHLVHRDIKPANIMVMGHPSAWDLVKVLDFGLVKDASGAASKISNPSLLMGTPQYISPEAIAEPGEVGPPSDLYGVAAVGYFLLTGTPVFREQSLVAMCAAHLDQIPEAPSVRLGRPVPKDLEKLLLRGLAKRPQDRPPTARAFRQALLACDLRSWTEDDARSWWADHTRARHPATDEAQTASPKTPATVAISLLDRAAGQ